MGYRALVVDRLRWLAEAAVQDGHAGSDRDAPVVGLHPIDQAPDCVRCGGEGQFLDLAQFWCLLRPPSGIAGLSLLPLHLFLPVLRAVTAAQVTSSMIINPSSAPRSPSARQDQCPRS